MRPDLLKRTWLPRAGAAMLLTLSLAGCSPPSSTDPTALQQPELAENVDLNPTGWWWYYGQTPAQASSLLSSNNARLVSLQVESSSPLLFTVAMVQNSGSYAKQWWWYYGQTGAQLSTLVQQNNARIAALAPYVVNGTTYYAAILLSNQGPDAKAWWWYPAVSPSQLSTYLQQNNARLVDLRQYTVGSTTQYAAVMIANTGADQTGWWWYTNVTPAQISSYLQQNNGYLISIEPASANGSTFDVVMNQNPGNVEWWWYVGQNASQVASTASQNGARVLDLKSYFVNGARQFATIYLNDANEETTRVGNLLRSATDGQTGFYLKQVGGPVLASLQENLKYDPASSIKIVVATALMKKVDAGTASLSTTKANYYPLPSGQSCPNNTGTAQSLTMGDLLEKMLENSDNAATRSIIDYVGGFSVINSTASSLGMSSTNMNLYPGCGISNTMTQADAAKLYEALANGTLISSTNRPSLYAAMPADAGDFTGTLGAAKTIISSLAPSYGLSSTQVSQFESLFDVHYKAGNDIWCTSSTSCVYNYAISGIATIPACNGNSQVSNQYVWGLYVNNATNQTNAKNAFFNNDAEPLREPLAAALASWASCSASFGGSPVDTQATGWWWYYGQTPAQVSSLLASNNARLVSLQVESSSPLLFTVAMVQNSGSYAKQSWWYYGQTGAQLNSLTSSLNARIADLAPYEVNGAVYYAAILEGNGGSDATAWWWSAGLTDTTEIGNLLAQHDARLIRLREYEANGVQQYAVVMYQNTGAQASQWWWYTDVTASQISSLVQQNNAYLIDFEPSYSNPGTFNVVMNHNPGIGWWWYAGYNASQLGSTFSTNGARPVDLRSYFVNGQRLFTAIELINH